MQQCQWVWAFESMVVVDGDGEYGGDLIITISVLLSWALKLWFGLTLTEDSKLFAFMGILHCINCKWTDVRKYLCTCVYFSYWMMMALRVVRGRERSESSSVRRVVMITTSSHYHSFCPFEHHTRVRRMVSWKLY